MSARGEAMKTEIDKFVFEGKTYSDCISVILPKFAITRQTFDKYWKQCQETFKIAQNDIKAQKLKDYTQSQIKQNKANILQREKVIEMASNVLKLAYNNVVASQGDKEQIGAFAMALTKYSSLEGLDAPTKTEQKIDVKIGKDLADESYT